MRFQYSLIIDIPLIDHHPTLIFGMWTGINEGTRLLTGFLEQILIVANKPFMTQKMVHPHNSGSAVGIFKKFFTIKGASRYMKIMLIIFSKKKNVWGKGTILD